LPPIHWAPFSPSLIWANTIGRRRTRGAARVPDGTKAPSLPFSAGSCAEAEEKKERRREEVHGGIAAMGKGGDHWDDSALVNAFDRAVSTFKVRALVQG
jgi:hypothetical protein